MSKKKIINIVIWVLSAFLVISALLPIFISLGKRNENTERNAGSSPTVVSTFSFDYENNIITLKNLVGMKKIDWGDGTTDTNLTHTYSNAGTYTCSIYGVTEIGSKAFNGCINMTNIAMLDCVMSIGDYAFNNCKSLTSATISKSLTNIGEYAFRNCEKLSGEIVIPFGVETIKDNTFAYCKALKNVVIPDSVTKIERSAFYNCISLSSITIPDSVTSLGADAFAFCRSLTSVIVPNSVQEFGVSEDGVSRVFGACSSLERAVINTSVIPNGMFRACEALTDVVISDQTTNIDAFAFWYCSSLKSIFIPQSITNIGEEAFRYCSSLTEVLYKGTAEEFSNITIANLNGAITNATKYYEANRYRHRVEMSINTGYAIVSGLFNIFLPTNEVITIDNIYTYANAFNGCVGTITWSTVDLNMIDASISKVVIHSNGEIVFTVVTEVYYGELHTITDTVL